MKLSNKRKLIFPLLAILFSYCSKKADIIVPEAAVNSELALQLNPGISIAQLRQKKVLPGVIYTTLENNFNGTWIYDPKDFSSADNTGTTVVTFEGKRVKRLLASTDVVYGAWFGFKGNGSDETATLQAAINASAGHKLMLPEGTFFARKIGLVSNLKLIGNNTKLRNIQGESTDNIFISLWALTNVEITGLEVALNGIRGDIWAGTAAIQIQNSSNIHIHHCFVHDNTYVGIRLTGGNDNIRVNNNFIENTDTGVHANNTNTNVNIISNIISKGTSEGITIYGYNEQNIPYNFLVDSNIIQYKLNSFGINIPYAKLGTITHNTVTNCLGGITLHDVVSVGEENHYTSDILINNNMIANCGFGIVYIGDRTTVTNNYLENIQQDGINVNNFDNPDIITTGVKISGNNIVHPAIAGGGRGGISVKNLINSTIDHNTISKCGNAFSVRFNGGCDNLTITENNMGDGMVQTTNTVFDKKVVISNNKLPQTYFPAVFPSNNVFKLEVSGNTYTSDTAFNTAPNDQGAYNDLNTYNVRTGYSLAAGTIRTLIPSWTGRIIKLKSTNSFAVKQGNNIRLKNGADTNVPQNQNISLKYDGSTWNEIARSY